MPTRIPAVQYHALREQIQEILAAGQSHTRASGEWEKIQTYWHIGDALRAHIDDQPRADYGERIIPDLSKDLHLSQSLLWDIVLFRRSLTKLPTYKELAWSHIREVLRVPTQERRRYYLQLASEGAWSVRPLRRAVHLPPDPQRRARIRRAPCRPRLSHDRPPAPHRPARSRGRHGRQ